MSHLQTCSANKIEINISGSSHKGRDSLSLILVEFMVLCEPLSVQGMMYRNGRLN